MTLEINWQKIVISIVIVGLAVAGIAGWWSSFRADLKAAEIAKQNERLLEQNEFMKSERTDWESALQQLAQQDSSDPERYSEGLRDLAAEIDELREELEGGADVSSAIVGEGSVDGELNVPGEEKRDVKVDTKTGVAEITNNDGDAFVKGTTNVKVYDKQTGSKILDEDVAWDDEASNVFDFDINQEHKNKYEIRVGFGLDTNGHKSYLVGGSYRFPEINTRFGFVDDALPDKFGVDVIYSKDDTTILGVFGWEF